MPPRARGAWLATAAAACAALVLASGARGDDACAAAKAHEDTEQTSAFFFAAQSGSLDAIKALIGAGSGACACDRAHVSAGHIAARALALHARQTYAHGHERPDTLTYTHVHTPGAPPTHTPMRTTHTHARTHIPHPHVCARSR